MGWAVVDAIYPGVGGRVATSAVGILYSNWHRVIRCCSWVRKIGGNINRFPGLACVLCKAANDDSSKVEFTNTAV